MRWVENNNFHQCLIDSMSSLYPFKAYSISIGPRCQHGWIKISISTNIVEEINLFVEV